MMRAFMEPLNQWSAAFGGAFDAILRFEKLEIHKVFLPFSNLVLRHTLSPNALAHFIRASLFFDRLNGLGVDLLEVAHGLVDLGDVGERVGELCQRLMERHNLVAVHNADE